MSDVTLIRVNAYWLNSYFSMVGWGYDVDDHPLGKLNMVNETSRAIFVEQYLLPIFNNLSLLQQQMVKNTLRYAVNFFSRQEWDRWTEYELNDITNNPQEMFMDIWGMMFKGEAWLIESQSDYLGNDDESHELHSDRYRYGRF